MVICVLVVALYATMVTIVSISGAKMSFIIF